jgi:anti-sigma regulatory factor (Ser/Thr protein kinase)
VAGSKADLGAFVHPALFYSSEQEYLDGLLPFIVNALAEAQPVLVAVPGPNLALLRDALGGDADDITMADMTQAGRNPGRILGGVLTAFAAKNPNKSAQMIGEPIWASRSDVEYPACVQHEALINNAFAGRDLAVLCPYDESRLDPAWIADARLTHPELWQGSARHDSDDYAPDEVWMRYNQPLTRSKGAVTYRARTMADLSDLRAFVAAYSNWFDLPPHTVTDLQVVVTELATSSMQHTDGACRLALWLQAGYVVCEAKDTGHIDDPLAGRRPYDNDTARGRCLFVINAVADLVRVHTQPGGTTVHTYLLLDRAARL